MEKNTFTDLVSSPLMNLDHTYRYSGTKLVESESLSQHIVDTIMMGLMIIDDLNSQVSDDKFKLNPKVYVMKAVYHDLEEVITGDVPRPLKYHNKETLQSLKDVADDVAKSLLCHRFGDYDNYYIWRDAKSGREGYILKIVDTLVVANKVIKEVVLLNNFYMLRVAKEVSIYLSQLLDHMEEDLSDHGVTPEMHSSLEDYVEDAIKSMNSIVQDHQDKIDLCGQSMI